ncbi:response regulator [Acidisoma silvae]|uniref:Response regulator n=1 Tax=Acidisoma silvae TaxID=2802396 RepID=A0A963YQV4_9PROT|nr:response regulator [Acidisoma silvae]MCB8875305.1 response regulator [Acidisoma silvae]
MPQNTVYARALGQFFVVTAQKMPPMLEGQSVLVVEDQVLIALDMEDMLHDLGAGECWMVSGVAEATRLIAMKTPDLALLDFNLGHETSEAVADRLMALAVPFVFVTGYGDGLAIADRFRHVPIVGKPVTKLTLAEKIKIAQGQASLCRRQ